MTEYLKDRNILLNTLPKNMIWAEIGVFKGEYSDEILARTDPNRLHLVDIWDGEAKNGGKDGDYDEVIEDMRAVYHKLGSKYMNDERVVLWRNTGRYFFDRFKHLLPVRMLDCVYIDACHDYDEVLLDLEDSLQVTKQFIMGHDYEEKRFPGVFKAVNTFCWNHGLRISHLTEDKCPTFLIPLQ